MSVSIVIPCFNQGRYLAESIGSVLAQTKKPLEIIIVDDGSTDNTAQVVSEFPQRNITYLWQRHVGNHTPARAMNAGIRLSRGGFIVCLAADDRIAPTYLSECLSMFDTPEVGAVYTGCQEFEGADNLRIPRTPHHRLSVLRDPHGQVGAMMVNRAAYKAVGWYDENLHCSEDRDMLIRISLAGWQIHSVKAPLHFARVHSGRASSHVDDSELYAKYPFMRPYGLLSRGFDAVELVLSHPLTACGRLQAKVKPT